MKLKDIPERGLFKIKRTCNKTLQVSHHLGKNRIVVKKPNMRIFDVGDFMILNGDTEVELIIESEG